MMIKNDKNNYIKVKDMLLREPGQPVKCYTFSLTDEEREKVRKNKKKLISN